MGIGGGQCPFRLGRRAEHDAAWLDTVIGGWLDDSDTDTPADWDPKDPANILIRPEQSWRDYSMCSAFDWQHLPRAGGLDDQEDIFLHDAAIIARRMAQLRKVRKANEAMRKEADRRLRGGGRAAWRALKRLGK